MSRVLEETGKEAEDSKTETNEKVKKKIWGKAMRIEKKMSMTLEDERRTREDEKEAEEWREFQTTKKQEVTVKQRR